LGTCSSVPPNALVPADKTRRFRITHPFHPYREREFELIEQQGISTRGVLFYQDEAGYLQQIPVVWTDLVKGDAFGEVAAGRSALHADCLWPLAELLQQLRKEASHGV
jgi:Family of unknown function (DUF5372)